VALVKKITIFEKLGFYVYANDDKIRIVNARLETRVLLVSEEGNNDRERRDFFADKTKNPFPSKLVQVSRNDLYIIGGISACPSLLARKYEEKRCCIHINLTTGRITPRRKTLKTRTFAATCHVNQYIYAIGGMERDSERYNVGTNRWELLPAFG